jgi:hypothetical protein
VLATSLMDSGSIQFIILGLTIIIMAVILLITIAK